MRIKQGPVTIRVYRQEGTFARDIDSSDALQDLRLELWHEKPFDTLRQAAYHSRDTPTAARHRESRPVLLPS